MGRMIALATRYEVSAQVASLGVEEREPAMCGSETLTTVVSSTSMKVLVMTVTATIQGFTTGAIFGLEGSGLEGSIGVIVFEVSPVRQHRRHNRHSRTQKMLRVLAFFKSDLHRNPLHNFHIIAGRVLWRQQAGPAGSGRSKTVNVALVVAVVGIDVNDHRLADAHVPD